MNARRQDLLLHRGAVLAIIVVDAVLDLVMASQAVNMPLRDMDQVELLLIGHLARLPIEKCRARPDRDDRSDRG